MTVTKNKIIDEINQLPEVKLDEVFDLIHFFRIGFEKERNVNKESIMKYAGVWSEMTEKDLSNFFLGVRERRNSYQHRREDFEKSID
ncbi:MAG: hypothetical protein ACLFQM_02900 [Fidelibacterota bacterium]